MVIVGLNAPSRRCGRYRGAGPVLLAEGLRQLRAHLIDHGGDRAVFVGIVLFHGRDDRLCDVVCAPVANRQADGSPADCDGGSLTIWEQGFGGWGGIAGNNNATGLDHSDAGFLVGVDVPVNDFRLGFFSGYSHSDFGLAGGGADSESNDYHLGSLKRHGDSSPKLRLACSL